VSKWSVLCLFDVRCLYVLFWLMPDIGVVFSSTLVFGPKARDSTAQANGLGLCIFMGLFYTLRGHEWHFLIKTMPEASQPVAVG
jgi:hypothetical protein